MKIAGKLIINSFALAVVGYLLPGVAFTDIFALIVTAIVLGIVNTLIRPVLQIIALPISIITFGIAALLINVSLLWFVAFVVPGFSINSFQTAVLGSILLSLVSWFLHRLEKE